MLQARASISKKAGCQQSKPRVLPLFCVVLSPSSPPIFYPLTTSNSRPSFTASRVHSRSLVSRRVAHSCVSLSCLSSRAWYSPWCLLCPFVECSAAISRLPTAICNGAASVIT
ncbi:hypothetical protein BDV18DRAFT_116937 [Aspergillus unguis]